MAERVDPLGRETHYVCGSNKVPDSQLCLTIGTLCNGIGIDVLDVRQVDREGTRLRQGGEAVPPEPHRPAPYGPPPGVE
jgi:hypothetical protein